MPAGSLIGQFTKSDFLSVLPPGFYIFTTVYSCYVVNFQYFSPAESLWTIIDSLANQLRQQPVMLIFLLFACYLLGSVFRALPVYWVEKTIPPFHAGFPYPNVLTEVVEILNKNDSATKHDRTKTPDLSGGIPMHVFNYWKDVLCLNTTEGFEYYQTFEIRVRLFAGIIWAGWTGILGSLYIVLHSGHFSHPVGAPLFVLSSILIATFGTNFRRVRRQEARSLALIYIAYLQKSGGTVQSGKGGN